MGTYPQIDRNVTKTMTGTLNTNKGAIKFELYPDIAPFAVDNFTTLAKNGYYDGIIFHRVIPNFMIQGGDPTGTGMGGQSKWNRPFPDEFNAELFNLNGAFSMANSGPNTNGSQFFIVSAQSVAEGMLKQLATNGWPEEIVAAYTEKGGTPWLDQKHTVFGHVVDGMDVVYAIEAVDKAANDKPIEDVVIESITFDEDN